jgi:hypothetical protein
MDLSNFIPVGWLIVLSLIANILLALRKEILWWVKSHTTATTFNNLVNFASIAVRAVEQLSFTALAKGENWSSEQKYAFAARRIKEMIQSRGLPAPSEADLQSLIESAVSEFNSNPLAVLSDELENIKVEGQ